MVPASIKGLSISSEVKLVFEGLVNGVLFNYTFVAFTILLFIAGCIMVIVGKKKNKKSGKYNNQYFVFQTQVIEAPVKSFKGVFAYVHQYFPPLKL